MCAWWNPADWDDEIEDAVNDVGGAFESVANATVSVASTVSDGIVGVSNTLVSTGNTVYNTVADGAVATFQAASGGVVYAVDWTATEANNIAKYTVSTSGDIAHFSVEAFDKTKTWAKDAWKYISDFAMKAPPSLGDYNASARDFMKGVLLVYVGGQANAAESIVKSWERDARKKGYTMAIDFNGGIQLANIAADAMAGVYVDNTGKWGYFANVGVTATIVPEASASLTMDLYMLFGGKSKYSEKYYFAGMTLTVQGFIVGANALLTSSFGFRGFQVKIGIGVSYDLFASGGSGAAKAAGASGNKVDVSPTLPGYDVYSVDLLAEQGSTTDVACQVAANPSSEKSIAANASAAMTMKSSSILASIQSGGATGGAFSDDPTNVARIQKITLRGGKKYVAGISITYVLADGSTVTRSHGIMGSGEVSLTLAEDEYVTNVSGRSGDYLDYVSFSTSYGRSISAGGSGGGAFSFTPQVHRPIIGIFGRAGDWIDAIGVYYRSGVPFTIRSKNSGLFLDVVGQMNASVGAATIQESSTGGPHQSWLLTPTATEGQYYIVNSHTGLCLESMGTGDASSLELHEMSGADSQIWLMRPAGDGMCRIQSKGTGRCVDVRDWSVNAGDLVHGWSETSGDNQVWRLAPVAPTVLVFSDGGYSGRFQSFGPGKHDLNTFTIGNDAIRSIRVPEGFRVTLYQHDRFRGEKLVLTRDSGNLGSLSGGVSSLVVEMPPWGATIYVDNDYKGASRALMPGRYASVAGIGFGDNQLSSVKVPAGWRVTLFYDENFGSFPTVLTADCPKLSSLNANDTASSIVVEEEPLGKVVAYTGTRFTGQSQTFTPGRYDVDTLFAAGGVNNDSIRSMKLPVGWSVILYEHEKFSGRSRTIAADCTDLGDFNDLASSLVVIPG